jgi:hypothetical protein
MASLEALLSMPRPARREYAWEQLTVGNRLFSALRELGQAEILAQAGAMLNTWQPFVAHGDMLMKRQWEAIKMLFTCAQIARLNSQTATELPKLLLELGTRAELPTEQECQNAAQGTVHWGPFVQAQLNRPSRSPVANSAWAWDAVAAFMGSPRSIACSEQIGVLLVSANGVIAQLILEQLSDAGGGFLFPDAAAMSTVIREQDFQNSEQAAVACVRAHHLWPAGSSVDVRWKLTRQDGKPLSQLEGGSAGAAFALGLIKLFNH